jgi:hypothetical protein
MTQFVSRAQRYRLLAASAVQGEAIGNLNIPAVLEYRVNCKALDIILFINENGTENLFNNYLIF